MQANRARTYQPLHLGTAGALALAFFAAGCSSTEPSPMELEPPQRQIVPALTMPGAAATSSEAATAANSGGSTSGVSATGTDDTSAPPMPTPSPANGMQSTVPMVAPAEAAMDVDAGTAPAIEMMGPGNMAADNMAPGNMAPGNMAPGNMAPGNMAPGKENPPAMMPLPLPTCMGGSLEPCGTFITSTGTEIELGPYGVEMMPNMGEGFGSAVATGDSDDNAICTIFTRLFGGEPEDSADLLDIEGLDMALYTVYRPSRWEGGERFPLITWGNGTCAQPEGYSALLRYIASKGYIVIAANSRWVGSNSAMTNALDYMFAANEDVDSPFYQRVDTEKVGAMGHSQGAGATTAAAADARIMSVILWNGGSETTQPYLVVTGDRDIANPTPSSVATRTLSSDQAGYLFYHMVPMRGDGDGHLTLMTQPERVIEPAVQWFDFTLNKSPSASEWFLGDDCTLCNREDEFEYGQSGLDSVL